MGGPAASPRIHPDDFHPPPWLRNRHLQSMLASTSARRGPIVRRAAPLIAAQREMLLDCGGGVRLQCFHSSPSGTRGSPVVLVHGWEGSADSLYVLSLGQELFERGFDVLRLNLRDHGDTHHLNTGLFHSCLLSEVVGAMRALQSAVGGEPLRLVGYSLGGNFMLRVGAEARAAALDIAKIIAVSPVLDPSDTLRALEGGFFGYPVYFVRKWWRSLLKKQAAWPAHYDFAQLRGVRDLRRLTAELIRRFTDFGTLEEYLDGYSITGGRLAGLDVPTTLFTSLDDPIIPAGGLERLAQPPSLHIVVTRLGGHCGFLDRLTGPTWVERRIIAELDAAGEPADLDAALSSA
ncbi:MAG TPA: alpha/beta fold hydrolase [Steroidobacteraceae bacterium]|nr:alpha/beta fold hydrolase [Steroidobacteraceae bacterium]